MGASASEYGIVTANDVMVRMRDGVRLATDIYRPSRNGEPVPGRHPTILGRTSYDKRWEHMWVEPVAKFFTPRGYVVAIQDLRGRHRSEGTGQYFHTANVHEGEDGYDTVEWIAAQPWSNGRVGMVGSSHGGIVQTAAALTRPPHLTAVWIDVAPTNIFAHEAREGGAMALHMFGALFLHAHDAQEIRDDPAAQEEVMEGWRNLRQLIRSMPFRPGHTPLRAVPNLEKVLFHYYYGGEYDDFWAQEICDQERRFERSADIPGVYSGGWYDPFAGAATGQYEAMSRQNQTPQRLVMGPWNHSGMRGGATYAGDADFGPDARWGNRVYNEHRLHWFDRWLKDVDNGIEHRPPVRIFVMGGGSGGRNSDGRLDHGGRWREEDEWPLDRARRVAYYLRAGGGLTTETPGESKSGATFTHDPERPVPTVSGCVTGLNEAVSLPEWANAQAIDPRAYIRPFVVEGGAHQQQSPDRPWAETSSNIVLADRPDVLVFQTETLEADVEVTGAAEALLWVSSDAVDTDLTAKLLDVYPPSVDYPRGYHLNLADTILRTRHRNGFEGGELMEPGQVYQVRIPLPPVSNLFARGHRIRVDIASSNFPRFDVNPSTGEPVGRHTRTLKARNTVYADRSRPSHIVLPIIPAD